MTLRRYLVGGNWKCNGTLDFSQKFPTDVLKTLAFDPKKVEVVVSPSTIHLLSVQKALAGTNVQVSAQNSSLYPNGAYTGETSA
jgi:triosephosphate isomerase